MSEITVLYSCEDILATIRGLLDALQSPTAVLGGSTSYNADDMTQTVTNNAEVSTASIMNQLRMWYKMYQDNGCGEIKEVESLLSNPFMLVAGRLGHYGGRNIR